MKIGYCNISYKFAFMPEDLGLPVDCDEKTFMNAVDTYIWDLHDLEVDNRVPYEMEIKIEDKEERI